MGRKKAASEWARLARQQQESGLKISTWCAQNGVNYRSFLEQTRKARTQTGGKAAESSAWVEVSAPAAAPRIQTASEHGEIHVEIGKFKIVVLSEFSEAAFSRVCKTLAALC
jgi:hypothetical protein